MSTPFDVPRARAVASPVGPPTIEGFAYAARFFRESAGVVARALLSAGIAAGALLVADIAIAADVVYSSAEATRPLQAGASVPAVRVRAVDGSAVDLSDLTRNAGALLVFYRGGW